MSSSKNAATEARLLQEASAPALQRLRDDEASAADDVRGAFATIERRLLDRGLTRAAIAESCPGAGRRFDDHFRAATGSNPLAYVRELRLEVAKGLLGRRVPARRVAPLVGYGSYRGFADAFKTATGHAPGEWRAGRPARSPEPPRAERLESWRRAFLGVAGEDLFHELLEKLLELYPEHREGHDLDVPRLDRSEWLESPGFRRAYEEFKVRRIAEVLERADVRTASKLRLVEEIPVASLALCDLLLERATEVAKEDLERSREWIRFAVGSLKPWSPDPRAEVADRGVLALARLASASFAVGDEAEGDDALARAEHRCRRPFDEIAPAARGALLEARAARRRLDVRAALAEAEAVYRELGDEEGVERVRRLGLADVG